MILSGTICILIIFRKILIRIVAHTIATITMINIVKAARTGTITTTMKRVA